MVNSLVHHLKSTQAASRKPQSHALRELVFGIDFARALHSSLQILFPEFGSESVTKRSHMEKVCLISEGVGRDNISDFTTNLIKGYLLQYTQAFALAHLKPK